MSEPLSSETLKALIEAILYVSPEPVTLEMLAKALPGESREHIKGTLYGLMNDYAWPQHGIQIRPVAGGWKFSSKPEHHEVLRSFVKSLKPAIRLTRPSLEVLSVIAYRQPITVPEINEIRGVDCGGVIHTLMERKLIATAGRKNVVGRPILYKTSREFMLHFGLRDLSELPSLREFEEMARQALGSELLPTEGLLPEIEPSALSEGESEGEPAGSALENPSRPPEIALSAAEDDKGANEFGMADEATTQEPGEEPSERAAHPSSARHDTVPPITESEIPSPSAHNEDEAAGTKP
jgi:segregation and condensation protein B